jgi:hypothetical protein
MTIPQPKREAFPSRIRPATPGSPRAVIMARDLARFLAGPLSLRRRVVAPGVFVVAIVTGKGLILDAWRE